MSAAEHFYTGCAIWLMVGSGVAVAFLAGGLDRVDEDARGAYLFRPLLVPGILLIWPLVLWRWSILERDRDRWELRHAPPRRVHRWVALILAVVVPLLLLTALAMRQHWPTEIPPLRLEAPAGERP